jgi:hypothetical protein
MKDQIFLNGKKPETCINIQNNKTIKHQNNKTQNIKHISGVEDTSEIETMSPSSLSGTRGASSQSSWVDEYYRSCAAKLKAGDEIFYVSVSVKGVKSAGARREVNIDVIPESAGKPVFLKSFTVNRKLKWELFRDLPQQEQTAKAWIMVDKMFSQEENIKAGKIKTRRKFRTIPNFRIGECACITQDHKDGVLVVLMFGHNAIEIHANKVDDEFFMYRGDWKNETECEVV